ncbi:unnamed protein product, partial [Brassica oleracea]
LASFLCFQFFFQVWLLLWVNESILVVYVRVIVKLKELEYTWSASCVHHFLANQLANESSHEMWSLIDYERSDFRRTYIERATSHFTYFQKLVSGEASDDSFVEDVDSLFLRHHINGDHWVALHIDLHKATIYVYDIILNVVKDHKQLLEDCVPFTKMIPLMLNKMLPPKSGKKS